MYLVVISSGTAACILLSYSKCACVSFNVNVANVLMCEVCGECMSVSECVCHCCGECVPHFRLLRKWRRVSCRRVPCLNVCMCISQCACCECCECADV